MNKEVDVVDNVAVAFQAIASEAYAWYNNPLSLGGVRPRGILPLALAYEVAQAAGASLTQWDLQWLVQKDGNKTFCSHCGKEFQPVKWVAVTDKFLKALTSLTQGEQISQAQVVHWEGSRIIKVQANGEPGLLSFCGPLFYYDPRRRDNANAEFFSINRESCLGMAYSHDENCDEKGRPRPLRSLDSALELIGIMKKNHEARLAELRQKRVQNEQRRKQAMVSVGNAFLVAGGKKA